LAGRICGEPANSPTADRIFPCAESRLGDDFRVQGDHPISPEGSGARELVADIDAEPSALAPHEKERVKVCVKILAMADLPGSTVILDVPVRG